jgi:hypothetical protein
MSSIQLQRYMRNLQTEEKPVDTVTEPIVEAKKVGKQPWVATDHQKDVYDRNVGAHLRQAESLLSGALHHIKQHQELAKKHRIPTNGDDRKAIEKNIVATIEWIRQHHENTMESLPRHYPPVPPPPRVEPYSHSIAPKPIQKAEPKEKETPVVSGKKGIFSRLWNKK